MKLPIFIFALFLSWTLFSCHGQTPAVSLLGDTGLDIRKSGIEVRVVENNEIDQPFFVITLSSSKISVFFDQIIRVAGNNCQDFVKITGCHYIHQHRDVFIKRESENKYIVYVSG